MPSLSLYTLGDVRIERDGQPAPKLIRRARALLVYLALTRPQAHPRADLLRLFWLDPADIGDDEAERRADANLRQALKALRGALGEDLLDEDRDRHTLRLNPARSIWFDVEDVTARADHFLHGRPARDEESPLAVAQGEFLPDADDLPIVGWVHKERARLERLHHELLVAEAQRLRAQSEYTRALELAQTALAQVPTDQAACAEVMFCLWRTGDGLDALVVYEDLKTALKNEGAIPLQAVRALRSKIANDVERAAHRALRLTNVPSQITSFVGRANELRELKGLLRPRGEPPKRLITLVGTGGSGKTRLAQELGAQLVKQYPDGVWWVELDALEAGDGDSLERVAQAAAQVVGVQSRSRAITDALLESLAAQKTLLLLDNCEHLLGACETFCARILAACPRVQIVATSRAHLRVTGAKNYPLAPLATPTAQAAHDVGVLAKSESVQLFLERAQAEAPGLTVNADNARLLAHICRRLDGLPLALELAAARLDRLTLDEIGAGLDERFELLQYGKRSLPRHETLRAVLDWSYDLLAPDERALFDLLGVFAGRFGGEAVEAVAAEDGVWNATRTKTLATALEELVEQSLVISERLDDGSRVYRQLETIRAYARERLERDSERADAAYRRMAQYYLGFAQDKRGDFRAMEREWDNLSAGLEVLHAREEWEDTLKYGSAMTDAAFARGLYAQAQTIFPKVAQAAERLEEQQADIEMRLNYARALIEQGYYPEARATLEQLLAVCQMAQDEYGIAAATMLLGREATERGQLAEGEKLLRDAAEDWERMQRPVELADTLGLISRLETRTGRYADGRATGERALALLPADEQILLQIDLWRALAEAAIEEDALLEAESYCLHALALAQGDLYRDELAATAFLLAQINQKRGDLEQSRQYCDQALAGFRSTGDQKMQAYVHMLLLILARDARQVREGETAAKASMALLRKLDDIYSQVDVWRHLGMLYRNVNQMRKARRAWANAMELIETQVPAHYRREQILTYLGSHKNSG